jgi:hypothetical protein
MGCIYLSYMLFFRSVKYFVCYIYVFLHKELKWLFLKCFFLITLTVHTSRRASNHCAHRWLTLAIDIFSACNIIQAWEYRLHVEERYQWCKGQSENITCSIQNS